MMKNQIFDSYYELAEKWAKEGDLEGAIACYHRVIAFNLDSQSKCFLDDLEAINFLRINAKELAIFPGNNVEETSEGYLSLNGNQGFVFFGPYIDIPDGLYRVRVRFNFPEPCFERTEEQDGDRSFNFDVVSPYPYVLYETKVDSHQTSLEFYLEFIEGNRTEFRFFSTGSAFSVNCIEMTLVYQPIPNTNAAFLYYFNLGRILQLKNQREKANQAYSRAVEYSPIETLIYGLITDKYALTLPPVAEEAYLSVAVLLEQQERWEEAIACYRKVLEITPNHARVSYKLSIMLAEQGQLDEAVACFQKAQKQPSEAEIYENIWKGLNQVAPLRETDIDGQAEIKLEDAYTYFAHTTKYTVIKMVSLTDLNESERTILEEANFSLANLELIKHDSLALEEIYIAHFQEFKRIKISKKITKKSNFSWNLIKPTNDFQQSVLETGYIYSVCPFTGSVLRSDRSFYLQYNPNVPILIYQFQSTEIFYLIVGTWSGSKIGIYFPRLELIINLSNEWSVWLSSEDIINNFKAHAVSCWRQFKSYISNEKNKEVVAVVGNVSNLGHYFWNQISGLYYLYENDLLHKFDKFLIGANEYFELASLFPEIPPEKIVRLSDNNSFFRAILDNNYFAVQVTDYLIKEDLAARIQTAAVNKCSQSFLQNLEAAKKHFPLIWINLRSHNKAWISQVEGYANIITKIFDDYPGMAVVFDGFPTEKADMEQIKTLISPHVKVYNALECPVHETIVWAATVDTYIAVIGSGLTLVTWIANKPGVAHSDRGHYSQMIFWLEVRENSVAPVLVPVDSIIDVTTGGGWENYNCDWKVIYDEVIKVVKNLDNSVISQSPIAQVLKEKWSLQSKLYLAQAEVEASQVGLRQVQEQLQQSQSQSHQNQNELDCLQVEYLPTRGDIVESKSQLGECQIKLQQLQSLAVQLNLLAEFYAAQDKLNDAPACKSWGNIFQTIGQLDDAKRWYNKALENQPNFAQAHANLGTIYAQQQQWQEAIASYQKAIAIQPNFAGVYRNLARVFSQQSNTEEAAECWYTALILEPEKATAEEYFKLGNTLVEQQKQDRAIICYRRAIYLNPSFDEAHYKLKDVLKEQGIAD